MNKYEKEVQKVLLDNEKEILEELEKTYTKALATIKSRINELQGKSEELTQSQIYQLNFQKNLEKQVSAIIDLLKQDIKAKTNTYLTKVYENSFIGESYNLYKSYEMSTIIGIDQQNVINIVTKPIENMTFAERTDINMNEFKKAVKSEISRGFSTGMSYAQMAQIISSSAERSMYKSYRIARTEGLRVQSESKINYANSIKQKYGADLVKQWDSTLDGKTRPEHQELDGQIKELDEKFKCSGGETNAPGLFGNPAMDCNCRCCLTHIPRWAINTPLSKIDNANPFKDDGSVNLIDGKNYNEYKKNYYKYLNNNKNDDKILSINECKELIQKYNIIFVEEDLNKIDNKLLSDNSKQIDNLLNKYPTMQEYLENRKMVLGAENFSNYSMVASFTSSIDNKKLTMSLSKTKYNNYDKFINAEKKDIELFHSMPCADNMLSVYSITHEFGHFVESKFIDEYNKEHFAEFLNMKTRALNAKTISQSKKILKDWEKKIGNSIAEDILDIAKNDNNFSLKENLSDYGNTDSLEFFAECFANMECGEPNDLGKAMEKYLKNKGVL